MANKSFIPGISRRRLLAAAAAAASATGIPPANLRDVNAAVVPGAAPSGTATSGKLADLRTLTVTGGNAQRFAEIEARQRIRRHARLPALDVTKELRKLYRRDREAAFGRLAAIHRDAIKDDLLAARRQAMGDASWQPRGFFEGVAFENDLREALRKNLLQAIKAQRLESSPPSRRPL
jgi:hypothetical protein